MYKYIIVDDEALIRKGLIKQLEALNDRAICIGEAVNGREAITLIENNSPAIAIIDMQMPIMAGTQLLPYLTEHYPHIQLIVISGYKDFDYVKHALSANAIDYLLKPFSRKQIQEVMLKAIDRLESSNAINNDLLSAHEEREQVYYEYDLQLLRNRILGYPVETDDINSKKLYFVKDGSNYLLLTFHTSIPIGEIAIQEVLNESGYSNTGVFLTHPNNLNLGFIILFITDETAVRYRLLCEQMMDYLSSFLHQKSGYSQFGISRIYTKLMHLPTAYEECRTALNSQTLHTGKTYYYFYAQEPNTTIIHWPQTDEFLFRLETGMSEEVIDLLNRLWEYYNSLPDITLGDIKFHLYDLTNQCWAMVNDYSKQYKPSISMDHVVKSIFQPEELLSCYTSFFINLSNMLKEYNVYEQAEDVIEKVKLYLVRNYQKSLTTEIIASYFYVNASYFSHLFHQKTGKKFIDYLNDIRIDNAKELLAKSDKKIYHIAKAVGYNNVKYFFRVFKKREGLTPEQYRKRYANSPFRPKS